jgi:hypothetical protein
MVFVTSASLAYVVDNILNEWNFIRKSDVVDLIRRFNVGLKTYSLGYQAS